MRIESQKFGTLIDELEAAALLQLEPTTLQNYRAPSVARMQKKYGVRWTKLGRATWYCLGDIIAAAERNMREAYSA